jgi:hypothetical protein
MALGFVGIAPNLTKQLRTDSHTKMLLKLDSVAEPSPLLVQCTQEFISFRQARGCVLAERENRLSNSPALSDILL